MGPLSFCQVNTAVGREMNDAERVDDHIVRHRSATWRKDQLSGRR
jgi:hypothetical protein